MSESVIVGVYVEMCLSVPKLKSKAEGMSFFSLALM